MKLKPIFISFFFYSILINISLLNKKWTSEKHYFKLLKKVLLLVVLIVQRYRLKFKLKDKLRGIINQGLTEPFAALTKAIILGDKKGLPADLREEFARAGISHLVAISGMHISIIAAMAMLLLLGLGLTRRGAFYLAILFLKLLILASRRRLNITYTVMRSFALANWENQEVQIFLITAVIRPHRDEDCKAIRRVGEGTP